MVLVSYSRSKKEFKEWEYGFSDTFSNKSFQSFSIDLNYAPQAVTRKAILCGLISLHIILLVLTL